MAFKEILRIDMFYEVDSISLPLLTFEIELTGATVLSIQRTILHLTDA